MEKDSNKDPYVRLKPSPAHGTACFYCGSGTPWFRCHCFRAVEAREGNRPKPRFIPADQSPNGRPIVVLDEEALANGWLKLPRYEKPVTDVTKSGGVTAPDVTKVAIAVTDVTKTPPGVTEVETKLPLTNAERQRRYREKARERKSE